MTDIRKIAEELWHKIRPMGWKSDYYVTVIESALTNHASQIREETNIEANKFWQEKLDRVRHDRSFVRQCSNCEIGSKDLYCKRCLQFSASQIRKETLIEASEELEKAFAECETLNLLHGAARVRAID